MKKEKEIFLWANTDIKAVVLCTIAACIFWLFNAMNHDYTGSISYPVEVVGQDENPILSDSSPKEINLNATGPGWSLLRKSITLNLKPIKIKTIYFGPEKYISSEDLLPLIAQQLPDIRINYISTDTLYLEKPFGK